MWKPTKKQHLTNKKYVDENGGSGSIFVVTFYGDEGTVKCSVEPTEIETAIKHGAIVFGQLMGVIEGVGFFGDTLTYKGMQNKSDLGGKTRICFAFSSAPDILNDGVYATSIWFDKETGECFMLKDQYPLPE